MSLSIGLARNLVWIFPWDIFGQPSIIYPGCEPSQTPYSSFHLKPLASYQGVTTVLNNDLIQEKLDFDSDITFFFFFFNHSYLCINLKT